MTLSDEVDGAAQLDELQQANRRLQSKLAASKARTAEMVEAVYTAARDAAAIAGRAKVKSPPKDRRTKSGEVCLVHATDWQAGKVNDTFNLDVLQERIRLLARKVAKFTEIHRADHPVPTCTLLLGGDMVEGVQIFPGQVYEIDASLYEQVFRCAVIVEELVGSLLETFESVSVWDMFGNHGRIGRRGDFPRTDNIDRLLYRIVLERFAGEPRVEWHHADSWYQLVEVGSYKALLIHGDQIRSFGGNLPAYGILRKVNAWSAGVLPEFTDAYIGHFHTPQKLNGANGCAVWMTGSPESGNAYAAEFVAAQGTPSQTVNFVDPEGGRVTAHYCTYLD